MFAAICCERHDAAPRLTERVDGEACVIGDGGHGGWVQSYRDYSEIARRFSVLRVARKLRNHAAVFPRNRKSESHISLQGGMRASGGITLHSLAAFAARLQHIKCAYQVMTGVKQPPAMCQRRPREYGIAFTVAEDTVIDGVMVGEQGILIPMRGGQPIPLASAETEIAYDRAKGRKVVLRHPTDPTSPSINPNVHLLGFDVVLGIDTNTRRIGHVSVSVGAVVEGCLTSEPSNPTFRTIPWSAVELHNVTDSTERRAWKWVCEEIMGEPAFRQNARILLVVDSYLESLSAINARSLPVVDDWFLPQSFTLSYASSDASPDGLANHLIRQCDRQASAILEMVAAGEHSNPLIPANAQDPYSHIRVWNWDLNAAA